MSTESSAPRRPLTDSEIDQRISLIRQLYAQLEALRPQATPPWRTGTGPLTEEQVAGFESRRGLRLPENYRRLLTEVGDVDGGLLSTAAYATTLANQDEIPAGDNFSLNTKPFPLDGPWSVSYDYDDYDEDDEDDESDEDDEEEDDESDEDEDEALHPTDGAMHLGGTRTHYYAWLVLNGPWTGTVWIDSTGYEGGGMAPAVDAEDLNEFVASPWWSALKDEPWLPRTEPRSDIPIGPDLLDLTVHWLYAQIQRTEVANAFDSLDAEALAGIRDRLDYHPGWDFWRYINEYADELRRVELMRAEPDREAGDRLVALADRLLNWRHESSARILTGRWQAVLDDVASREPDSQNGSEVDEILAHAMLGQEPPAPTSDSLTWGHHYKEDDRWVLVHALRRAEPEQRDRFLRGMAARELELMRTVIGEVAEPVTPAVLDTHIARLAGLGDIDSDPLIRDPIAWHRPVARVLVARALAAMEADASLVEPLAGRIRELARLAGVLELVAARLTAAR